MGGGLTLRAVRADEDTGLVQKLEDATSLIVSNCGAKFTSVDAEQTMLAVFQAVLQESADGAFDADFASKNYVRMLQFLETEVAE